MILLILLLLVSPVYGDLLNSQWEGLQGLWNLQEGSGGTIRDQSSNGNHGTLTNSPVWVTGAHGNALFVSDVSKYVDIANGGGTFVVSKSSPFSAGGVFRQNPNASIGVGDIFMSNRTGWPPGAGWHMQLPTANGGVQRFGFVIGASGADQMAVFRSDLGSAGYIDGKEHTFIVTYNGGNCLQCIRIYVD